jgi:hypothetical protein
MRFQFVSIYIIALVNVIYGDLSLGTKEEKEEPKRITSKGLRGLAVVEQGNNTDQEEKQSDSTYPNDPTSPNGFFEGDIIPDYESILTNYGSDVVKELEDEGILDPPPASNDNHDNGNIYHNIETGMRWSNRVNGVVRVPYVLDSAYDSWERNDIKTALKDLEDRSKVVKFVPRSGQNSYLNVQRSGGCGSYVGKQGNEQIISLSASCLSKGTIQHEFMHALGIFHEQARPDRDNYININWENIQDGRDYNFKTKMSTETLGNEYDYGSVMHYGKTFFSKNGKATIESKNGAAIGQRSGADNQDIIDIRLLYQCASGARTLSAYNSYRCTDDCKCWQGQTGCNGSSNACQGNLVCSNNQCVNNGGNSSGNSGNPNTPKSLKFNGGAKCLSVNRADRNRDIAFWDCNSNNKNQQWTYNQNMKRIESNIIGEDLCLNWMGGRNIVNAERCRDDRRNQKWYTDNQQRIRYGSPNGKCLTKMYDQSERKNRLTLKNCARDGADYLNQRIAFA